MSTLACDWYISLLLYVNLKVCICLRLHIHSYILNIFATVLSHLIIVTLKRSDDKQQFLLQIKSHLKLFSVLNFCMSAQHLRVT